MVSIDSFNLKVVKVRLQDNKFPKVSCLAMEPELKSKSVGFEAEVLSSTPYCSVLPEHIREGWAVSSIFQEQLNCLPRHACSSGPFFCFHYPDFQLLFERKNYMQPQINFG